jgi:hypothetical protein
MPVYIRSLVASTPTLHWHSIRISASAPHRCCKASQFPPLLHSSGGESREHDFTDRSSIPAVPLCCSFCSAGELFTDQGHQGHIDPALRQLDSLPLLVTCRTPLRWAAAVQPEPGCKWRMVAAMTVQVCRGSASLQKTLPQVCLNAFVILSKGIRLAVVNC